MIEHEPHHDELLQQVVTGTLSVDSEPVRALALGCQDCRIQLEEFRMTLDLLDGAARERAEDLLAAAQLVSAPGRERVGTTVATASGVGTRRTPLRAILIATAAAAVIWIVARTDPPADDALAPGGIAMGDKDGVELLAPRGPVEGVLEFSWRDMSGGKTYLLRIFDAADPTGESSFELELWNNSWIPTTSQQASLPERFDWQVVSCDAYGTHLKFSERFSVWRSSHQD